LELTHDGHGNVTRVRGDVEDPYSRGYLCPKGASLGLIDSDPGRLQSPLVRLHGELRPVSWDDAFAEVERLIRPMVRRHGCDSLGLYTGNPIGHDFAMSLYLPVLQRAMKSKQQYSASTLDSTPHTVVAALMFGHQSTVAVPDIDRTDLFLIVGGNPMVSNGSIGAAPDYPARLRALRERGGRLVVIDPVRTETAALADEHILIRPGTDAFLLLAMVRELLAMDPRRDERLAGRTLGREILVHALEPFTPDSVTGRCGVPASTIRRLAHQLVSARTASVYGRLGTTLNRFGTFTSWAMTLLNILSGHLDRPGGMMFAESAAGSPTTRSQRRPEPLRLGRYFSTVRRAPEVFGEFPAACLAEEILNPAPERLRGLIVVAGNPARSVPNTSAVEAALQELDALVCVDAYVNETSRFAHVVLPAPAPLTRSHFDLMLSNYTVRNVANYSPPLRPVPRNAMAEWRILVRLAQAVDPEGDTSEAEINRRAQQRLVKAVSAQLGIAEAEIEASLSGPPGPDALLDLRVRSGPFGDHFGHRPGGLTLARLAGNLHTTDLGPLRPRLDEVIRTASGRIELAPPMILNHIPRLVAALSETDPPLLLIGRRTVRSKNSWLHNIRTLVSGRDRCTLKIHPADAERHGVQTGEMAVVRSAAGSVEVVAEVDDAMAPGVCSLPHGWGHDVSDANRLIARQHPGVNSNQLAEDAELDPIAGTPVLNGISVVVRSARSPATGLPLRTGVHE
jgi:anaerobic selenocysteine-containing dehydrogenase